MCCGGGSKYDFPKPERSKSTDRSCCIAYLFFLLVSGLLVAFSVWQGNFYRLTHAYQWDGKLCGVSDGVENEPYLFYCRAAEPITDAGPKAFPSALDYESKTCVSECPTSKDVIVNCLMKSHTFFNASVHNCPNGNCSVVLESLRVEMVQSVLPEPAYESELYRSRYCVPAGSGGEELREKLIDEHFANFPRTKRFAASIKHGWPVVLGAVLVSLLLGRLYLYLLKTHAGLLIFVSMWAAAILMTLFGIWFLLALFFDSNNDSGWYQSLNPFMRSYWGAEAKLLSMLTGLCLLVYAFGVWHVSLSLRTRIDKTIGVVKAAMDCVHHPQIGDLSHEPFWKAFYLILELLVFGVGFMFVITVGKEDNYNISVNDEYYQDLVYTFKWYSGWWIAVLVYSFTWFWVHETMCARFHFAITHSVAAYYMCDIKERRAGGGFVAEAQQSGEKVMVTVGGVEGGGERVAYQVKSPTAPPYIVVQLGRKIPGTAPFLASDVVSDDIPDMPKHSCWDGSCFAFEYALGSLAKAAIMGVITAPVRAVSFCIKLLAGRNEDRASYDEVDQKGKIRSFVMVVASFLDNSFEGYGKNSFLEMVLNGSEYSPAANRNFAFLEEVGGAVGYLFGVCATYGNVAVLLGTILVAVASFIVLEKAAFFSDPLEDSWYVPDPAGLTALIVVMAASTLYGVIAPFAHGADVLLYTFAWNRRKKAKSNEAVIPSSLKNILQAELGAEPDSVIHPHGTKFDNFFHAMRTFGGTALGTHAEQAPLISTNPYMAGAGGTAHH